MALVGVVEKEDWTIRTSFWAADDSLPRWGQNSGLERG